MKKYLAELVGTCALTLIVILSSVGVFPVPTPILAGFTLMLFVYSIGSISGCHINPAVTIGLLTLKKISEKDAGFYIIAQLFGAGLALFIAAQLGMQATPAPSEMLNVAVAEALGMFFFTFGIASVVLGKAPTNLSGVVVGGSLFLGIAIASLAGSGGILNPAVALGLHSFFPVYILGPIVGSVLGMQAYAFLAKPEKTNGKSTPKSKN